MKPIGIICTILLFPFLSQARIALLEVVAQPSSGNCNGIVKFSADGTAGPFRIKISGASTQTLNGVNGVRDISGLCAGEYAFEVESEVYPICSTIITFTLEDGPTAFKIEDSKDFIKSTSSSLKGSTEHPNSNEVLGLEKARNVELGNSQMQVFPNPFTQTINIELGIQHSINEIEITNSLGQRVKKMDTLENRFFTIDLSSNTATLYFIKALDDTGRVVEVKQVIKLQ